MKPIQYEIYVEGGLHDIVKTKSQATRIKNKAESEGWNVKVVAIYDTFLGHLGKEE